MTIRRMTLLLGLLAMAFGLQAQTQTDRAQAIEASLAETQERLDLSDEQRSLVEPILRKHFEQTRSVLEKYGVSPGQAGPGGGDFRKMRAMAGEMKPIRERTERELAGILTPAQMAEFREMQDARRAELRSQLRGRASGR